MANIRQLAPELALVAREQLNEVDVDVVTKIQALRTWLNEEDYIQARTDDQFLVAFLRFCHWDLEEAKKRILFYYTYKTKERELLKSRFVDDKLFELARSG